MTQPVFQRHRDIESQRAGLEIIPLFQGIDQITGAGALAETGP